MMTTFEVDHRQVDRVWSDVERRLLVALGGIRSSGLLAGEQVIVLFESDRPAAWAVTTFITELTGIPVNPAFDGLVVERRLLASRMPDEWKSYRFMLEGELGGDEIRVMLANETGVMFVTETGV